MSPFACLLYFIYLYLSFLSIIYGRCSLHDPTRHDPTRMKWMYTNHIIVFSNQREVKHDMKQPQHESPTGKLSKYPG